MVTGSQSHVWSGPLSKYIKACIAHLSSPKFYVTVSREVLGYNQSKSQHGGACPAFEPHETVKVWLIIIEVGSWICKIFAGVVLTIGSSFLLGPTLDTSPKPHLQKVLLCRHPCYTWDPVWSGKSQLPCSQRLRLHGLTSSVLGPRSWDPMWTGPL